MTPAEFDAALDTIGWSRLALSKRLGVSQTLVEQWHKGLNTRGGPAVVPVPVARWLRRLATWHDKNPPPAPATWRKARGAAGAAGAED